MAISAVFNIEDLAGIIASFMPAPDIFHLSQTNRNMMHAFQDVIPRLARNEQRLLRRSQEGFTVLWRPGEIIQHLLRFSLEDSRSIRDDVNDNPLAFYSTTSRLGMRILQEDALAVRNNPQSMQRLIIDEPDFEHALVLVYNSLPEDHQSSALAELVLRDGVPPRRAWEIACSIPDPVFRDEALRNLALSSNMLFQQAWEIACSIQDPQNKNITLRELALKEGVPLWRAWEIIRSIPDPVSRNYALRALALKEEVPLEQAKEIAGSISDEVMKRMTLEELDSRTSMDFSDEFFKEKITDPSEKEEDLDDFSKAFDKLLIHRFE